MVPIKGGREGTLDFEVLRHLSEERGITQQLYMGGGECTFSESSLNFISENVSRSRDSDFIGAHVP